MAAVSGRGSAAPQSNLYQQDLTKLDVTKLSALSPEVISRQATINIGTIGHVAHGKSTVVKAISGVQTVRFKNELERNITIKLERLPETVVEQLLSEGRKRKRSSTDCSFEDSQPTKKKKRATKQKNGEYIVEDIVDLQVYDGIVWFFVKWKDWPFESNTWEPRSNLLNCPTIMKAYLDAVYENNFEKLESLKSELSFSNLLDFDTLENVFKMDGCVDFLDAEITFKMLLIALSILPPTEENEADALIIKTRDAMQKYEISKRRNGQIITLKRWEESLNIIDVAGKIRIENDYDFSLPPDGFEYINKSVSGRGVVIPEDPPIGCECTTCNCKTRNCCGHQGGFFPYLLNRRLRVSKGTPIYECNKSCKCGDDCNNRVVQNGRKVKLCIFRTRTGCGWGVRTESKIKEGQFVCQYVGEVITSEEAEKRGKMYDQNGLTYLFDLDFNSADIVYTIDAANKGNISHFINHSCDPNLGVWAVWGDCLDPNLPMLALFATRDIEPGEELSFDYNQKTNQEITEDENKNSSESPKKTLQSPCKEEGGELVPQVRPFCKCGSPKCRGFLF